MNAETPGGPEVVAPRNGSGRGRVWGVRGLIVLATLVAMLGVLALWIDRVALDNETYTETSAELLAQPEIQEALSIYLVDQLYTSVDVEAALSARLPPAVQGLAGPASVVLRDYAQRAALRLLQSERVQQLWIRANQVAHARLIVIIDGDGDGGRVSVEGADVVLDVNPLVSELGGRLGLEPTTTADGRIVILRADQLSTAQTIVNWLKAAALFLPFIALGLYALAIYLARGRRREAVRACGVGLIIAALVLILIRRLAGEYLVDSLTSVPTGEDAARAAWSILAEGLADTTTTLLCVGLVVVAWAWATGDGQRARRLRRALAPTARHMPARVWLALAALMVLLVWWAPTQAFRRVVPVIVLGLLAVAAVELLRRQAAAEYPQAAAGETTAALRTSIASVRRGDRDPELDRLEQLTRLRDSGALTPEEFEQRKRDLLS